MTKLSDLIDKKTLKQINENVLGELPSKKLMKMKWNPVTDKKAVKEANPDGTISKDEPKKRAKLIQDTTRDIKKIIDKAKKEADKIGGTFRGIGIRHEIHKQVKEIVNHLVRS